MHLTHLMCAAYREYERLMKLFEASNPEYNTIDRDYCVGKFIKSMLTASVCRSSSIALLVSSKLSVRSRSLVIFLGRLSRLHLHLGGLCNQIYDLDLNIPRLLHSPFPLFSPFSQNLKLSINEFFTPLQLCLSLFAIATVLTQWCL